MNKQLNEFEKLARNRKFNITKNAVGDYVDLETKAAYTGWLMFQEHALAIFKKIVEKS